MPEITVALATAAELPDLDEDERLLLPALDALGIAAQPAVWDDPAVDWSAFALVVIRSTWDYPGRHGEFLAWAEKVAGATRLANPAPVVAWNTDKTYLGELAASGIPVVPTSYLRPGDRVQLPEDREFVVKPAVSAGSKDSSRYDPEDADEAAAHVRRLLTENRTVMVQPYLAEVDTQGETAIIVIDGEVSHVVRKGALLQRGGKPVEGLYAPEDMSSTTATPAELAVAEATLAAVPTPEPLLYARVDLLPDPQRGPVLLELELTEPSLFLRFDEQAPHRLAAAIAARVGAR